eukprot:m.48299 g.48299  ORF g.48299 m.48299 type:complete len:75 (-) comp7387_c1_seq1:87-311(-)
MVCTTAARRALRPDGVGIDGPVCRPRRAIRGEEVEVEDDDEFGTDDDENDEVPSSWACTFPSRCDIEYDICFIS